jgi:hypothetical protein
MVGTHHKDGCLSRGPNDSEIDRASLQMGAGRFEARMDLPGFDNILSAARRSRNLLGSLRGVKIDGMAINDMLAPVRCCGGLEQRVYRVVPEH